MKQVKVLVINGPNLNLLGNREPKIYGKLTLQQMNRHIRKFCRDRNIASRFFQSNSEGDIIDCIHESREWAHGIVINPGAYTHYSYAIRDAISAVGLPTVEVHLSHVSKREVFRGKSVIKDICIKQIEGLKWKSYTAGIEALLSFLGVEMVDCAP